MTFRDTVVISYFPKYTNLKSYQFLNNCWGFQVNKKKIGKKSDFRNFGVSKRKLRKKNKFLDLRVKNYKSLALNVWAKYYIFLI